MHCDDCPKVMGLDLALTKTGGANVHGEPWSFEPKKLRGLPRLWAIREAIRGRTGALAPQNIKSVLWMKPDLVAIEDFAFGAKGNAVYDIGGLAWIIRMELWELGVPFMLLSPSQIKKYAVGNGSANKAEVLIAAHKRLGYDGADHNEADAMWCRALALACLGHPVVDLPKVNQQAVTIKMEIYQ